MNAARVTKTFFAIPDQNDAVLQSGLEQPALNALAVLNFGAGVAHLTSAGVESCL